MKRITLALTLSLPLLASQAQAGAVLNVAEASAYTLAYSLAIPDAANFNFNAIPYAIDNHASIANGSFSRIAYYMELQAARGPLMYAYVSMDAFTNDASKIGVPNTASGAFFQQNVKNMNVFSNVTGIANGTGIDKGNIEFWHFNYGTLNAAGVVGANNDSYDFGDHSHGADNYGSMQIHNFGAGQTILDYNNWGSNGGNSDIGLGNQVGGSGNLDWTFAHNTAGYTIKNLEVLVLTQVPEPGSLALIGLGLLGFAVARRKAVQ